MTSQYGHGGLLSIFFGGKYDLIQLHRQIIYQYTTTTSYVLQTKVKKFVPKLMYSYVPNKQVYPLNLGTMHSKAGIPVY